jgi:hypothetical protein
MHKKKSPHAKRTGQAGRNVNELNYFFMPSFDMVSFFIPSLLIESFDVLSFDIESFDMPWVVVPFFMPSLDISVPILVESWAAGPVVWADAVPSDNAPIAAEQMVATITFLISNLRWN